MNGEAMINVGGSYAFLPEQDDTLRSLNAGDYGTVSLKADNGQFVRAADGGGSFVYADRTDAGPDEKFIIHDLDGPVLEDGDHITLRARAGQYLQAEDGGQSYSRLLAQGGGEGQYEIFVIKRADGRSGFIKSGDAVRLQSTGGTPYYVMAQLGEDHPEHIVDVNSLNEGPWETFTIVIQ